MKGIVAARAFNTLYIYLDTGFILLFIALLLAKKRYMTALFGILGGLLYFAVDYGIFNLMTHSRQISGGSMFWVLLWMSMSYGFTNFAWIWLCLKKDRHIVLWTVFILAWWIACPMLSETFGNGFAKITISRTTGAYHGYMALFLFASYLAVIIHNLFQKDPTRHFAVLRLVIIGVAVQFGWEFCLLIGGVRSPGIETFGDKLRVLTVNSLVETNLGLPAIYAIYIAFSKKYTETFTRREKPLTFYQRLAENNAEKVTSVCKSATAETKI